MARYGGKIRKAISGKRKRPGLPRSGSPAGRGAKRSSAASGGGPAVSVIIPVLNEKRTLAQVLRQVRKLDPGAEVLVIANGTRDGSDVIAGRLGAKVIRYAEPLGHDVGRSIGAQHAQGDILLFLDADIVIPAGELRPFIRAVANGIDVALNDYSGPTQKPAVHSVVLAKHALNHILGRPDLKGTSMTTVPHAISRRALGIIGAERLAVPPAAHAAAVAAGLAVAPVHAVNVGRKNPIRRKTRKQDPLERLIFGDHLEAIGQWMSSRNARGDYEDLGRNRLAAEGSP